MNRKSIATPCPLHKPNSQWRTCDACARRRQGAIADRAEELLNQWPSLAWVRLAINDAGRRTIDAIRDAYLRQARTESGIWTIESGEERGHLHANIITQHHQIPRTEGAEVWIAPVTGSVRNVAAYIAKKNQIPDLSQYHGRLYGQWGTVAQWMLAPDMPAAPRALAVEAHILRDWGPMGLADPRWLAENPPETNLNNPVEKSIWRDQQGRAQGRRIRPDEKVRQAMSRDEFRLIAERHLPKLMAIHRAATENPWPLNAHHTDKENED